MQQCPDAGQHHDLMWWQQCPEKRGCEGVRMPATVIKKGFSSPVLIAVKLCPVGWVLRSKVEYIAQRTDIQHHQPVSR